MFCVKCKRKTPTTDEYTTRTRNNRKIHKGICTVCGSVKNKFVGGSILNKALNVLPLPEMHLKSAVGAEQVPGGSFNDTNKYSFCGPFTKLRKRLLEGYSGINSLDRACLNHDIAYETYTNTAERNHYDDVLSAEASKLALNENIPDYERKDARFVNAVIAAKSRFGLGFKLNT